MEGLKDLLVRKTVNWFSYVVNVFWILLGIILSAIFLEIENSEPSSDFRCGSNGDNEEVIGVKCYEQYEKQYNKFGIPVYGFVIFNFFVTAGFCGFCSQAVKSIVDELEGDAGRDIEGRTSRRKLFKAYCLQLLARYFTTRANGRIGWPAPEERALVMTLFSCMYENNASDREVQNKLAKIGCNSLYFSDCSLSPLDCLALVHALKSVEGILDFCLGDNKLQSLGCKELAKLFCGSEHNQLNSFTVSYNPISDEGVNHLVTALTHINCKLNDLRLDRTEITDEGVKHLTVALTHTNCKLNSLSLEKNQITDEGAKQLTLALTHTNCKLIYLSLGSNEITNEGARLLTLAITHSNCKLKYLYLRGNWGITHEHKVRNKTCEVCT